MRHSVFLMCAWRRYDDPQFLHARLRRAGFESEVRKSGFSCTVYDEPFHRGSGVSVDDSGEWVQRWVEQLPKPCGVFGGEGNRGAAVLSACRVLRLEVPAQVAVVAACNEDWWEFFAGVSMSYIALPFEQIGYEAAARLQRLVEGGAPPRALPGPNPGGLAPGRWLAHARRTPRAPRPRGLP